MCKLFKLFRKPEPEPEPEPQVLKVPYYKVNLSLHFKSSKGNGYYFLFDEKSWASKACAQFQETNTINIPEQPIYFSFKEDPEDPIISKDIWIETLYKTVKYE